VVMMRTYPAALIYSYHVQKKETRSSDIEMLLPPELLVRDCGTEYYDVMILEEGRLYVRYSNVQRQNQNPAQDNRI
jgi:hypothetical protein